MVASGVTILVAPVLRLAHRPAHEAESAGHAAQHRVPDPAALSGRTNSSSTRRAFSPSVTLLPSTKRDTEAAARGGPDLLVAM